MTGVVSTGAALDPGMVMGLEGSPADGAYPVALSRRACVWADPSDVWVQPGDPLANSDTRGHVMVESGYAQARRAIIGKAPSLLEGGQGLILVLVSQQ
jgi:hypothetical protein